ncbi:centromere-associated protein E isoform X3 [Dunckerocampus dactyliophorus]|uniref:centromere-associated protein E isoform X3 n=1 Tax=Dunckerocampus dactyliophorus TaxID=161453 RepID=UPI002405AE70|nr:centromere-associated protein E isoform X3 [Dunckerocampus dactyliophorus]
MAEESAVKVCVRVRPTIEREENVPSETAAPVQLFWKADKNSIYQIDDGNSTKSFSYDRVFTVEETTNQLYQAIAKPLVVSTVEGYNGTIFAYGQTSSGKTFTMMGSDHAPGVIPLAVEDVFNTIKNCPNKKFLLRVSYMEIYNETVTDLLVDSWKRKPLEVRETINKNIYVADLTEEVVKSPAQALAWIRKGEKNRHYEKTKMNQRSSRSHTIFRMILESEINADGAVIVSHLNLVDLAGSERASQTGAEGTRFKEGCNINRSLFTLGQVIKKLSEESQRGFTNYRDSKLTRILQNSLGGNAKTVIICTITAAALDETLSTLQFASTAKKMKNDPHVTEVSDDGALLKRYRNEIVELKRRLHEVSSVTQTTATEKEVLAQLLQEKDQLQKEQEDRIKNLTKLMVTSTNVAQVQRLPKRRVTWGGKMMRLAAQSTCESSPSNRSFAESATRKRKADRSCLMDLVEYDEDFDSHWEIPEEPLDDPDSSPSFVTVRGFENRTSCREAELELQLQTIDQQKQQALEKILAMEEKAAEVDIQLKTEAQQRSEAMAKVETLESSMAELKRQLEEQRHMKRDSEKRIQIDFAETVQLCEDLASEKDVLASERNYLNQELGIFMEQTKILEKEVACLSRELEEKRETDEFKSLEEQFRNEHENELQNEISSLKMAVESRDLQSIELQKSFETVSEELKQKTKFADYLQTMVAETQGLLRSLQDELHLQKQSNLYLGKEQKESENAPEEMEKLVSEVAALTAERDSLKMDLQENVDLMIENQDELRTALEKICALKEQIKQLEDSQTSNSGKPIDDLTTEFGELQTQNELQNEISSLKMAMESRDLQCLELQKSFETVSEELKQKSKFADDLQTTVAETQGLLRSLQDELQLHKQNNLDLGKEQKESEVGLFNAPEELEKLISEVAALTAERDSLKMDLQENVDLMIENQGELRTALEKNCALKEQIKQLEDSQTSNSGKPIEDLTAEIGELQTQIKDMSQELDHVKAERDSLFLNKEAEHETSTNEIQKLLCNVKSLSEERDQLHETVEGLRQEKSQLRAELEERMEMLQCGLQQQQLSSAAQSLKEEQETQQNVQIQQLKEQLEKDKEEVTLLKADLQENVQLVQRLTEELEDVRAERDAVQSERSLEAQTNRDEMEKLMDHVTFVNEERDQLQNRLEVQSQETSQLRTQLEEMVGTHQIEKEQLQGVSEKKNQLEAELQQSIDKIKNLSQDLDHVKAERDSLFLNKEAEHETSTNEIQKLLCNVKSLSEERDQLHETVEGLRQEKSQLRAELEERMEMLQCGLQQEQLSSAAQSLKEEQEAQQDVQIQQLKEQLEKDKEEVTLLKADLEENVQLVQRLTEELEDVRAERDTVQSERSLEAQTNRDELEKLMDRVTFVNEERDQLQNRLEVQSQETSQLRTQLEEMAGTHQTEMKNLSQELDHVKAERDSLFLNKEAEHLTSTDKIQKLLCQVTALSEEGDQLHETVEGMRQEKSELRAELEGRMEMMMENQGKLREAQEKIRNLQDEINLLTNELQDADKCQELQNQVQRLTEELEDVRAERDTVQSERSLDAQANRDEMEKLMGRVTLVNDERDQLQSRLELQSQETNQLRTQLEEMAGKHQTEISTIQERSEQTLLTLQQQQVEAREREAELQQQVQQLEEQLKTLKGQTEVQVEPTTSQQLPNEAKTSISVLNENQNMTDAKVTVSSCLQDSTLAFQELFGKLQQFINACSHMDSTSMNDWDKEYYLANVYESSLTPDILEAHSTVCQLGKETFKILGHIGDILREKAKMYKNQFDEFVKKDLSNFEEWRLLLGGVQVPTHSIEDQDNLSKQKLTELLLRRQFFLQKMGTIMDTLNAGMASCSDDLSADKKAKLNFVEQLEAVLASKPVALRRLDSILRSEVDRRSAVVQSRKMILQGIIHDHNDLCGKVQQLKAQVECHLQQEKSRRCTLQQTLGAARLKRKVSSQGNNQLNIRFNQSEKETQALRLKNEQLEEAHKMAIQQLQAELLDVRAQVEKKENAIQVVKNQLQEKNASPSAAQLAEFRAKLFKMELEMSSASDKHQKEIQRMTVVLNDKDRSLWRLKETLRTLQQRGEGSFLQGEELHERLTNPRGLVVTSSIVLEKNKLEEEVKQLQVKIAHLESQQAEITKWKNRAVKLKVKSKQDTERSSPPCTPTKREVPLCSTTLLGSPQRSVVKLQKVLESPRQLLNSPKSILLDSPKSRFFDVAGNSEMLLRTCPKQFFDNSSLGTFSDADTKDESSRSPRHEELCKMQ